MTGGNTGSGWAAFSQAASLDYNVLVHTYCADLGTPSEVMSVPAKAVTLPADGTIELMKAPEIETETVVPVVHPLKSEVSSNVLGYNVYRLSENDKGNEGAWTKLNQEAVTETSFKDAAWKQLEKTGNYLWAVKAVYASGESEPAFTNALDANGVSGLSSIMADGKPVVVTPNPCDGNFDIIVTERANVVIASVSGAIVYRGELQQGTNAISLDNGSGVYLVNVVMDGKKYVTKLVVK